MKRKIVISIFAVFVFMLPIQMQYIENANAAVASKVASAAAKQMAKIPIKELTKDLAFDIAANAIGQQFNEKLTFKFEENYEGYCMTEIKADGSCGRVVQVKKDLTAQDITNIDNQVGQEIDKAITSGNGLTKWQKFLDWFVPIWLVSAALTAITYAFDSDVRSLFNEIGYNTLVSLGLIKEVTTNQAIPIESEPTVTTEPKDETALSYPDSWEGYAKQTTWTAQLDKTTPNLNWLENNTLMQMKVVSVRGVGVAAIELNNSIFFNLDLTGSYFRWNTTFMSGFTSLTIQVNDMPAKVYTTMADMGGYGQIQVATSEMYNFRSIANGFKTRYPYKIGDFYYFDSVMTTSNGDVVRYQLKFTTENMPGVTKLRFYNQLTSPDDKSEIYASAIRNKEPLKMALVPPYTEPEITAPVAPATVYEKDGNIALVPPTAIPYTDADTGESLTRTPSEVPGEEPIFTKPDGTIVPGDKVDVGTPNVTETPEGVPQVTPTPTPTNPAPEPVPLVPGTPTEPTPDGAAPPGTSPPATGEEPPLSEFPEGEKCDAKLQFPIFSPLKEQLSTSFPFSIPWDIERAAHAAFDGVGNEKPAFDLVIPIYGGEKYTVKISTPEFMDKWKPFMDGVLLLTFDLLMMFGLYRFVKGAGS